MTAEQLPDHCGELDRAIALQTLGGAPVDRGAHIHQQPDIQRSLDMRLAHIRSIGSRGAVPVDMAYVVAGLILADLAHLGAESTLLRPLVAPQGAGERLQDGPMQTTRQFAGQLASLARRPLAIPRPAPFV